jgi:predicted histidine transporter YuiF (NhaC family)
MTAQMIAQLIPLHMGGIPETAMVLGPILLILAFLRIARRNEANLPDDEDNWNSDLGDLP